MLPVLLLLVEHLVEREFQPRARVFPAHGGDLPTVLHSAVVQLKKLPAALFPSCRRAPLIGLLLQPAPDLEFELRGPDNLAVVEQVAQPQLDAALSKLDATVDIQLARVRDAEGEQQRQGVLERDLRDRHMMPVVRFALGRLAGTPNIKALTPSASQLRGARLADAGRAMAVAAVPHAAQFKAAAFPADFVQQLTAAADAVQGSIDTRRRKIADRVGATAGVEAALKDARSAALMVEGAVCRLVVRGTPLFQEWTVVRRIVATATRSRAETSSVADRITPVIADVKQEVAA